MKKITDFLLLSYCFTAVCVVAMCMSTEGLLLGHRPDVLSSLHVFLFGATLLVYNMHFFLRRPYLQNLNIRAYKGAKLIRFVISMAGVGMVLGATFFLPAAIIITSMFLGFFSFAYSFPILPFLKRKKVREHGWAKITDLTIVWTAATAVLPMMLYQKNFLNYPFELIIRALFVFVLCLIFDMRDQISDAANNINTIPNLIGIKNCNKVIRGALVLLLLFCTLQFVRFPIWPRLMGGFLTVSLTLLVARYLNDKQSQKAYLFLGDGLMLAYAAMVLLL